MVDSYKIERLTHGIAVFGSVSISDLVALSKAWKQDGYTILDAGIASSLGATFVVTSEKSSAAWRAEIDEANADLSLEFAWLKGTDTGTSSKTIFSVLSNHQVGGPSALANYQADIPYDPGDFGRCHRLLEKFPAWRERLGEVAEKYPIWAPFVHNWEKLTALYVSEVESGTASKTYELLQKLRGT